MDFTLTDDQQAIADLAHRILSEQLPPERLRELEQTDAWFADAVWAELGKADLLGIALPEADGGGGYGILEACLIAEQVGRTVAPGALPQQHRRRRRCPLAQFGSEAQRKEHLPDVIAGAATLTLALYEPNDVAVPVVPTTQATADGAGLAPRRREVARRGRRSRRRHPRARPARGRRRRPCSSWRPPPPA